MDLRIAQKKWCFGQSCGVRYLFLIVLVVTLLLLPFIYQITVLWVNKTAEGIGRGALPPDRFFPYFIKREAGRGGVDNQLHCDPDTLARC